jgi:hypothetical protein
MILASVAIPLSVRPVYASLPVAPFPLGNTNLVETRTEESLADGVTYYSVRRATANNVPTQWLITAGVARTVKERSRLEMCLRALHLEPRRESYQTPGLIPTRYVEIIGGDFTTEAAARVAIRPATTCKVEVRAAAASPYYEAGPWRLNLIEIDPAHFKGHIFSAGGNDTVAGRIKTSDIAHRFGAQVAINGGFFAMTPEEGVVGEPAGISVMQGRWRSEATLGRPYLLLRDRYPISAAILSARPPSPRIVWSDGTVSLLGGINRQPGQVRDCGTTGAPANRLPAQDVTCAVRDEIVAITDDAGFVADASHGLAVTVGPDGRLKTGSGAELGGTVLVGIGRKADFLRSRLARHVRARMDLTYDTRSDKAASSALYAVNGAPTLVRGGEMIHADDKEGWATHGMPLARWNYVHSWSVLRNPRTAVGIDAKRHVWLLVVEGREYSEASSVSVPASAGLSIEELRRVMVHIGARDAINLDGGGSSAMVVRGKLITHPSDSSGERAVGDAILVVPDR